MKKLYTLISLVLLSSAFLHAQLIEEWDLNTNMFPNGATPLMMNDHEGNLILVRGESFSGSGNYDYSIQKYTAQGDLLWEIINEDVFDELNFNVLDMTIDSENNIILGGNEMTTFESYRSTYLMKISPEGDILWGDPVTGVTSWYEEIVGVVTDDDDNIYVTADIYNPAIETLQEALIKVNPTGDVLWSNFYDLYVLGDLAFYEGHIFSISPVGVNKYDTDGNEIWSTPVDYGTPFYVGSSLGNFQKLFFHNNEIRLVNEVYSEDPLGDRIAATCLNQSGDILWANTYDALVSAMPAENEAIYTVDCTMDENGKLYLLGRYHGGGSTKGGSFGEEYSGVYSVSIDNSGSLAWRISIPLEEGFIDIHPNTIIEQGGQVLLVCEASTFESDQETIYGRLSSDGSSLWNHHRMANTFMEGLTPRNAIESVDGEIYVSGPAWLSWTEEVRSGVSNTYYINKYDLEELQINVSEITTESSLVLWPNPAKEVLNIESKDVIQSVRIIGLDGKLVYQKENMQVLKTSIDVSQFASQLYSVSIVTDKGAETVRFAKN